MNQGTSKLSDYYFYQERNKMKKALILSSLLLLSCTTNFTADHKRKASGGLKQLPSKKSKKEPSLSSKEKKEILRVVRGVITTHCKYHTSNMTLKRTKYLEQKRGVFVTLRKNGDLRGCIGSIEPNMPLYELIPEMAQAAAFRDGRFNPVKCNELKDITMSVSILTKPHTIPSYSAIEIGKHGIILSQSTKSAVYLPEVPIEQRWNREKTLTQLALKANLPHNAWQDPKTTFKVFESMDFSE